MHKMRLIARWSACGKICGLRFVAALMLCMTAISVTAEEDCGCWDTDGLDFEAKALPRILDAVSGRTGREPDAYHQTRLDRALAALSEDGADLSACDDAAEAAAQLGRAEDAIGWMQHKLALQPGDAPAEAETTRARTYAKMGKYHLERWLSSAPEQRQDSDLHQARESLRAALAIDPESVREEKYRLRIAEWLIHDPGDRLIYSLDPIEGRTTASTARTVLVLASFIEDNAAWEHPDILLTLAHGLHIQKNAYLAYAALLRARELAQAGAKPLRPGSSRWEEELDARFVKISDEDRRYMETQFQRLRAEAQELQRRRDEFVAARLEAGLDPRNQENFWAGYTAPPAPVLEARRVVSKKAVSPMQFALALPLLLGGAGLAAASMLTRRRARQARF